MTTENPNPNPDPASAAAGAAPAAATGADPAAQTTAAPGAGTDTAAAAAAAKPAATTIVDTKVDDPNAAKVPADWPADWRDKLAGGDKALLKQLETLGSPADVFKAYRALQTKLTSGEYKKANPLPANATPEQVAAWRKENDVPEKPEEYDLTLPGGLVIGEQDKPIVDEFLKEMHGINASKASVNAALSAYFKIAEDKRAAAVETDHTNHKTMEDSLRAEWGPEYRRNQNAIGAFVETLPEGFRNVFIGARLADGTKLLAHPEGVKLVLQMAKEANPAITVVPGSDNPAKTIEEELKGLNVGSDEYWKDPKKQARAGELYAAQEKLKPKQPA